MATTAQVGGLLQRYYKKGVAQTFSDEFWADSEIQKAENLRWDGDSVRINIHDARNFGAGAVSESGTLPTPGNQNTQQGEISRKFVYGRIRLTGPAIWAAQSEANAFKATLDFEMERMIKDIISVRSFHLYTGPSELNTTGLNGIKAKTTAFVANQFIDGAPMAAGTGGTLTLSDPGGWTSTGPTAIVPNLGATRYLRVGEPVAWGTGIQLGATPAAARGSGVIIQIDRVNQKICVTGTGGTVANPVAFAGAIPNANDLVCRGWSQSILEANRVPTGLGVLVQHNGGDSFQGIPHNDENWAALNFASPVANFAEKHLHRQIQVIREVSGSTIDCMVSHPSMSREYIDVLDKDVRFEPKSLKGGYEVLTFSSGRKVKWIFDNDCPYGVVIFLTKNRMMWAVNRPWMWDDTDGAVLRSTDNTDEFTARYCSYYDLGFTQLNCHGVLTGITQISGTFF